MTKISNAERFISSFNEIEEYLKDKHAYDESIGFTKMINDIVRNNKSQIVRMNLSKLRTYASLRNAIVHNYGNNHDKKEYIIAEPHDDEVNNIEKIERLITKPRKVFDDFNKPVLSFELSTSIFDAINEMFKKDFSQVPILDNGCFVGLLNANTITRWLGATENKEIDNDGSTIIMKTQIKDVLKYTESENSYKFIDRNAFQHDVFTLFEENKELEALFITHNGKKTEKLLGIITIWDLATINKTLNS